MIGIDLRVTRKTLKKRLRCNPRDPNVLTQRAERIGIGRLLEAHVAFADLKKGHGPLSGRNGERLSDVTGCEWKAPA